ncbi:Peptidoglycan/xylan/chitin deacetylase, PgdA/CDA1 family [Virgibacillus subterraneus]|uniref:Peptidoglycan/xylan/chitin deacetylase, PgdA/CDA1 family n=1 Tax=Virgibacillus subterraneus TaxID=621109 RepID=A0A1H9HK50_9BACI|nr:polysaccharide deacetylase family protein [Virgibacillus subterraneus]SEQ62710.1 Peptidoglycan/xylan/chitin deacetylase, PgdA/CDA1 family [Virgibacillus subterraneus]
MKKLIWILLVLLVFVTACEESKTINSDDKVPNQENTKEQTDDVDEEVKAEEDSEKEDAEKEEEKMSEPEEDKPLEAQYIINEENSSVMPLNDSINEKVVLLTIDDAPHKHSLEMAKTLKELNASAIFFVNGHFLDTTEEEEILKKIHDMGFEIGNHTYNHPLLPDLSKEEQKKEIISLNDRIEEIIGERPEFFRAPNGENTDFSKEVAKDEGMVVMKWTYGYDWVTEYRSKEAITDIMLETNLLSKGANLLMHDHEWTAKALKDIVTGLREKGYEMVDPSLIQTEE